VPEHCTRDTMALLSHAAPQSITPDLWILNDCRT